MTRSITNPAVRPPEASARPRLGRQILLASVGAGLLSVGLGGCSSVPSTINPVTWWHDLQGGAIAEQRPPPPGANDPYPNLATVPDKPAAADPAVRQQIAQALIADRTNAQHAAAADPLPDPSSKTASPGLFGTGSVPPPPAADSGAATASLQAATPPPAPPPGPVPGPQQTASATPPPPAPPAAEAPVAPPSRAPVGAVQTTPLSPLVTAPAPAEDQAALPPLPTAAPPAADLPGAVASPAPAAAPAAPPPQAAPAPPPVAASAPAPATPAPPPATPSVTMPGMEPVAITFPRGSATLSQADSASLKGLASHRGAATIAVIGYGEATSSDPNVQSAALTLGLNRAQAMATALAAAGVPPGALRIDAEAAGRGGAARLVE